MGEKKIPKPIRKLNLAYKVIMAMLAGLSLIFSAFADIDPIYYKVVSVFSSAFPVIWSQILDATKTYTAEETPESTPKEGSPDHTTSPKPPEPAADDTIPTESV